MKTTTCKGCKAPIIWIVTKRGKKMPVDAATTLIMTPDGEMVKGNQPHWGSCPKYKEFKADKRAENETRDAMHEMGLGDEYDMGLTDIGAK